MNSFLGIESTQSMIDTQSQNSQHSRDDSSISLKALTADCKLLRHVSIRTAELVEPPRYTLRPASALLLEAYLMDKNDHERRMLRLSLPPELPRPATDSAVTSEENQWEDEFVKPESPWSSWQYIGWDDEYKRCALDSLPKKTGEAESEPGGQQRTRCTYQATTPSTTAGDSSPAQDSVLSDVGVSGRLLAARHIPLHYELQQAGLGGLGDGISTSTGKAQRRSSSVP
ncbi:hypothetical protein XA68_10127 [Ophiocordyceps unilateralis]|uniref:Uncharacterized protein n=1 Tax=Ophiocordyceps unilateralis TaxID=268505 RepID=A0A2A9P082_OPHUN|nr:hypothetical protein XA68_10127 [Ophiocordyceps unilateralis]